MNTTTIAQIEHSIDSPAAATSFDSAHQACIKLLRELMTGFEHAVAVKLWSGTEVRLGDGKPKFTLVLHDPSLLRRMLFSGSPLTMAEGHFKGQIDFEGDVFDVLRLRKHFESLKFGLKKKGALLLNALRLPAKESPAGDVAVREVKSQGFWRKHTHESDKEAISFHYDVSNEFYKTFLDDQMVYSCAYFAHPDDTLEKAQENKLDMVCKKLRLRPGDRVLDIGCGWGAMVCWAAKHYGVHAYGVTLSKEQLEVAKARIKREGLQGLVQVELRDYRDVPLLGLNMFDKISSIGMFEHVGLKNLAEYNKTVYSLLKPNGLFLNHGITHNTEGFNTGGNTEFLQKFVFPDGELDLVSNIARGMELAGFEILDVEALRPHYARTLREWVARLEKNKDEARRHVDESTLRVWRMYMAGSAIEFEDGGTGIHQILAGKWRRSNEALPMTREDLYR